MSVAIVFNYPFCVIGISVVLANLLVPCILHIVGLQCTDGDTNQQNKCHVQLINTTVLLTVFSKARNSLLTEMANEKMGKPIY